MYTYLSANSSQKFEILNMKDSLRICNENTDLNKELTANDNYMSAKYIDIIVNSPVFYNLELIPTSRYKYQSQFTKCQFHDAEIK